MTPPPAPAALNPATPRAAPSPLGDERLLRIRQQIADGYYDRPEVTDQLIDRLGRDVLHTA